MHDPLGLLADDCLAQGITHTQVPAGQAALPGLHGNSACFPPKHPTLTTVPVFPAHSPWDTPTALPMPVPTAPDPWHVTLGVKDRVGHPLGANP